MDVTMFKLELTMITARISSNIVESIVINRKLSMMAIFVLAIVIIPIGIAVSIKAEELSNDYVGELVGLLGDLLKTPFLDLLPGPVGDIIDQFITLVSN